MNISRLFIVGALTNECVHSACHSASDLSYDVYCVDDACAAPSESLHTTAIENLHRFATVLTTKEVAELIDHEVKAKLHTRDTTQGPAAVVPYVPLGKDLVLTTTAHVRLRKPGSQENLAGLISELYCTPLHSCGIFSSWPQFMIQGQGADPVAMAESFLELCQKRRHEIYIIEEKVADEHIGVAGIMTSPTSRHERFACLAMLVHYWNQGFASETMKSLAHYIFSYPEVRALFAQCPRDNDIAQRMLEDSGFQICEGRTAPDAAVNPHELVVFVHQNNSSVV